MYASLLKNQVQNYDLNVVFNVIKVFSKCLRHQAVTDLNLENKKTIDSLLIY